ncbi:MAG: hypothetical protein VKK04_01775 [Synechococcales bacterium]|nr:hypothetical protein [Synechococcales bacterium]
MAPLQPGTVGILPPGALGVGLFYHLTRELTAVDGRVFFLERRGSRSGQALRESGALQILTPEGRRSLPTDNLLYPDLLDSFALGHLPEVVLVCPNPDQILPFITTSVQLLEKLHEADSLLPGAQDFPHLVLCANGIYFQRFRQIFIEKIEEATLFGRLPDLWPHTMPAIVSRFLRGVTIQTGVRDGNGADTLYRPGPKGLTQIAGGDAATRLRCCQILQELGGWFEAVGDRSATRLEFDKALVNLACNLLGQIYAIDDTGSFQVLTVGEIAAPSRHAQMRELAHHVFQVGRTVRAYAPQEKFEDICDRLLATCRAHADHVPSSLQWVSLSIQQGTLKPEITPTEAWLLEPLLRYARASELPESVAYFESLKQTLVERLARLVGHA